MTRYMILLTIVVTFAQQSALAAEALPDSPYSRPEFARLMDAVTFRVSFDNGSMTADMAEGEQYAAGLFGGNDKSGKQPRFAKGLIGQALVLGTGGATYPAKGNVLFQRRGAIAVWIRPQSWQRPNDNNTVFAMTSRATFYLQRQGPAVGKDNKVLRHEGIQYLARGADGQMVGITGGSAWQNDRWYLLVANWSWPTFELSVNGEPFKGRSLNGVPAEESFGNLVLGGRGDKPRGLLDEFIAFRRPLTLDEANLLLGPRK